MRLIPFYLRNKIVDFFVLCLAAKSLHKGYLDILAVDTAIKAEYVRLYVRLPVAGGIEGRPHADTRDGRMVDPVDHRDGRVDAVRRQELVRGVDIEGTPLTAFEALAMGKPIVSTDADGLTDILTDRREAWVVPRRKLTGTSGNKVSLPGFSCKAGLKA